MRRPLLLLLLAAALVVLTAGCGGDDGGSGTTTSTTASTGGGDTTTTAAASGGKDLSSYDSVAALAADLNDAGLSCTLEYEGLKDADREVSLCAVNGEYTELSIWTDPTQAASAAATAASGKDPFVEGANWTIDVDTAATATAVADALGGRAVGTG